jgi:hypothetical protein
VAFGDLEEIRSADLVEEMVTDLERPWAQWKHGRPLTQKQLAGLLKPFGITSETVHPAGRPHGKGYKRTSFLEAWAAYLPPAQPSQNTSSPPTDRSEACKRANADEMGTSGDFRSVQETILHGSKNDNLSYSHAGLHACTDRKPGNGKAGESDQGRGGIGPLADQGEVGSDGIWRMEI